MVEDSGGGRPKVMGRDMMENQIKGNMIRQGLESQNKDLVHKESVKGREENCYVIKRARGQDDFWLQSYEQN